MTNYQEKDLESFIEEHLISYNAYIKRINQSYDKALCLDGEMLYDFILSTQGKQLDELKKRIKEDLKSVLLKRIASVIKDKGILKALQSPLEVNGVKFSLAYPKPIPLALKTMPKTPFLLSANFATARKITTPLIWCFSSMESHSLQSN